MKTARAGLLDVSDLVARRAVIGMNDAPGVEAATLR